MMAQPHVIASVAQLLGVDPRADRKTFTKALERELTLRDQADPQAVAQLRDDERLLDKAMKDGKITAVSRPVWRNALREDRNGAKALIAAMPECLFIGAQANVDGSSRTPVFRSQIPDAAFEKSVTTLDEMNAAIEADESLHRGVWAIGVRDGLKPPSERFTVYPDVDKPWDLEPKLITHEDGTGHYETPEPDDKWLTTQGPRVESRTGRRGRDSE